MRVRDGEVAFYVNPEGLQCKQVATSQELAGIPNTVASCWTLDSGDVGC